MPGPGRIQQKGLSMSRKMTFALSILFSQLACAGQTGASPAVPPPQQSDTVYVFSSDPVALGNTFTSVAEEVGPAVVTITSRTMVRAMVPGIWGFEAPHEQEFVRQGLGSGVIVSPDGYIVTNNHVVSGADLLEVILQDGSRYSAEIVGADSKTDVAVIRIEADSLPVIEMGDSDSLRVGEWVLAVGSPFALSQTVTQGIVSFIGRTDVGLADYENYIQTDAAINPGNSGGALVNLSGELVGINSAIASSTGGYEGIGFAIPINSVRSVMEDLIQLGYVSRGWLGVSIQDLSPGLASEFGAEELGGVLISEVLEDSPASEAGMQRGDIVFSVGGIETPSAYDFRTTIASFDPGRTVELQGLRDGEPVRIEVTLSQAPGPQASPRRVSTPESEPERGWAARDMDPYTAREFNYSIQSGALVTSVDPGSSAEAAGLQAGDVVTEVDGEQVGSVDEMHRLLAASGDEALLLVWRQGHTVYLVLPSN
jgi:serine protease Do